uniref:Uncharacterized protein n=1 Tax=Anguilla anguilla TaxID=7936 RepID=A0A0E9RG15_ANGAN
MTPDCAHVVVLCMLLKYELSKFGLSRTSCDWLQRTNKLTEKCFIHNNLAEVGQFGPVGLPTGLRAWNCVS